jgi:Putative prokaryotic signal transducing protein
MREVLRTTDPVLLSLAESLLRQAGVTSVIADRHISVQEGSIGAFPRRLLVRNDDWGTARRVLTEAGLNSALMDGGETLA